MTVVETFAQFQREVRTLEEENKMHFTKTYVAAMEEDRVALHDLLRRWFIAPVEPGQSSTWKDRPNRTIWIQDLVKRMKQFKLQVEHEPERPTRSAWMQDLTNDLSHHEASDGDTAMEVATPTPTIRRERTAALPADAAEQLQLALTAGGENLVLPDTLTSQFSLLTHAYVVTAIADAKQGRLIVQLHGGMRIDAAATYAELLTKIDGRTPTLATAASRFKSALASAYHDVHANRIEFTMLTTELADEWNGEQITILNRLVTLRKPKIDDQSPDEDSLDRDTYEVVVCNLGGRLSYLNIWHLFHGLMRLPVIDVVQAPADATGLVDPTRWNIVFRARGCPPALVGKTRIAWHEENVWIHHKAFARQPPCTRCDHADHTARKCPNVNAKHPAAVINVDGPLLDISDAETALAQQTPQQLHDTLREQEARLTEQSMMGGEDRPAPAWTGPSPPMGPPLVIPAANRVRRPRLWRRICEFERTQIVRKLLRLREIAAASEEWRLEAHSYRMQPITETVRPPEADNDHLAATLRLFRVTAARPVPELAKPTITDVETDAREKLNWPDDGELRDAVERQWAAIKKQLALDLARERRRIRANVRKAARMKAAAQAARDAANARLPFTSPLQQQVEEERTAALQALVPLDAALQRAALAAAEPDDSADHTALGDDASIYAASTADIGEDLPENMDLSGAPSGITVTGLAPGGALTQLMTGPFGMATGAKKPAHQDYPASLLPVMRGRERVKMEAARPYEAKHKRGSKPQVLTLTVEAATGKVLTTQHTKRRRNKKRDNGQSTITRHFQTESNPNSRATTRSEAGALPQNGAAATAAGAMENLDPDTADLEAVQLVKIVPAPPGTEDNDPHWEALLVDLRLTEVTTPPDGHCLLSACYTIKTGVCPRNISDRKHRSNTRKETNFYREGVYAQLLAFYHTHVKTGLIDEQEYCRRVRNRPVAEAEVRAYVQQHMKHAQQLQAGETAPVNCWGGETEIKGLVYWFREPLLVFDKSASGDIFAWFYHLSLSVPDEEGNSYETVSMVHKTEAAARAWLDACAQARMIPLVMALHRPASHQLGNHFNGVRILPRLYIEWASTGKKRAAMKLRRNKLLASQGIYVPPTRNPLAPTPQPTSDVYNSDSTYRPTSASDDQPSASTADANGTTQPLAQETEWTPPLGPLTPSLGPSLSPWAPGSPGATSPTTPLFQASLVTPHSPLSDDDYMMLLGNLLPQTLVPSHLERWLKKATRDNRVAYAAWKKGLAHSHSDAAAAIDGIKEVEEACDRLLSHPDLLFDLFSAIPYVPVVLARTPDLLLHLGQDLLILGRTAHMSELLADGSISDNARQHLAPWRAAVEACGTRAEKWALANSASRWGRLRVKIKAFQPPRRQLLRMADTAWGELLAHVMINSSALPADLRLLPVATRSKELMCWMARPTNTVVVHAAANAFALSEWKFPKELFEALTVDFLRQPTISHAEEVVGASRN